MRIAANFFRDLALSMHRFLISSPDLRIDASFSRFNPSFVHRFLISGPNLGINARFSPFSPSFVHRFLISGSDLRINASFSRFNPSCVRRFLISGPNLGIDARFSPFSPSFVHRFLISGPNLGIDAAPSLLHRRIARLQRPWRLRGSASDSILRCRKGEWFRLLRSLRQRFPRPIPIFVAASKNSPPAAVVAKIGFARLQHCRRMQAGTGATKAA